MGNIGVEKTKPFTRLDLISYKADSLVNRTNIKKPAGKISILSFVAGEGLAETIPPFNILTQIIDGEADIIINGTIFSLVADQSIIILAHTTNIVKAKERFKMISTVI